MPQLYKTPTPSTVTEKNTDIFTKHLQSGFENSVAKYESPIFFKVTHITPVFKKGHKKW